MQRLLKYLKPFIFLAHSCDRIAFYSERRSALPDYLSKIVMSAFAGGLRTQSRRQFGKRKWNV